jgi:hypothetical protein
VRASSSASSRSRDRQPGAHRIRVPQVLAADLERIRVALTLQRDQYLPLKVIREHLDALEASGGSPAAGVDRAGAALPPRRALSAAGASHALLGDAVSSGMLPAAETYPESAVSLLRALVPWTATASDRATCGRCARAPSATSPWSSRRCPLCCAAPTPRRAPGQRDRARAGFPPGRGARAPVKDGIGRLAP